MNNESLTRKDKYKIIKKFSKLSLKSVCERNGVSRTSVYMEYLSDKKLDKIIDTINEDIVKIWEK